MIKIIDNGENVLRFRHDKESETIFLTKTLLTPNNIYDKDKRDLEYCFDKFLNAAMHIEIICNRSDNGRITCFSRIHALLDQCASIDKQSCAHAYF